MHLSSASIHININAALHASIKPLQYSCIACSSEGEMVHIFGLYHITYVPLSLCEISIHIAMN